VRAAAKPLLDGDSIAVADGKIAAIKQQLDEAKALRAEAEQLRAEYAAKIAGAEKDAEAMLLKAVEAKPDFALAHFWLGMASFNLNKKAAAKEHLEKYLELEPEGSEAATAKELLPLVK